MSLIKWQNKDLYDPWSSFDKLQSEINDLFNFDRFGTSNGLFDQTLSPALDIVEGENDFTVVAELPGVEEKDLDVSIAQNVLTIKGEKKTEKVNDDEHYYKKETFSGSFQRTVSLPDSASADKINAELKDGVLTIVLPKKEEAKPKQISVKVN